MKNYLTLFFLFFLSCSLFQRSSPLDRAERDFIRYINKSQNARIAATGGLNWGKTLYYHIKVLEDFKIDEARVYVLTCLNKFYEILEKQSKGKQEKIPLTEAIAINFVFGKDMYHWVSPPNIAVIFFENGLLRYKIYPKDLNKLVTVYEETLDQAKEKVKGFVDLKF